MIVTLHLSRWMEDEFLALGDLTVEVLEKYLDTRPWTRRRKFYAPFPAKGHPPPNAGPLCGHQHSWQPTEWPLHKNDFYAVKPSAM